MINASNKGMCIEFWRQNNTTLVYLLSNWQQVVKTKTKETYNKNKINRSF